MILVVANPGGGLTDEEVVTIDAVVEEDGDDGLFFY